MFVQPAIRVQAVMSVDIMNLLLVDLIQIVSLITVYGLPILIVLGILVLLKKLFEKSDGSSK
jgi:hypothetical protein